MKKRWIYVIVLAIVVVAVVIYSSTRKEKTVDITVKVEQGKFDVIVSTTGELQALNSVDIRGPEDLREARVHNVKIVDLIPEGTVVKMGDYVSTLDRTEATSSLQNMEDQIERDEASLRQTQLDTTMSLRDYRNQIKDLEYAMEEREIVLEQSKFEPPATIRQAEMNLDKARRAYEQAVANYDLKKEQAAAAMVKAEIALKRQVDQKNQLLRVLDQFVITAPQDGMVIYKKEWGGAKRKVGSQVSAWDPVVATLPDLTKMISRTYVNEIDISKIKPFQTVTIGVDAFPERQYTGVVTEVANIGEQLPNSDAKVFEVVVLLNESDTTLRPAMTSVNKILTNTYDSVVYIPLETVHSTDSMSYVIKVNKKTRQIVDLGEANENFIIVNEGVEPGEELYLTVPEGSELWETVGWDIYERLKQRRLEEEQRKKEEGERIQKEQEERMRNMQKFNIESLPKEQRERMQQMMRGGGMQMPGNGQGSARAAGGSSTTVVIGG